MVQIASDPGRGPPGDAEQGATTGRAAEQLTAGRGDRVLVGGNNHGVVRRGLRQLHRPGGAEGPGKPGRTRPDGAVVRGRSDRHRPGAGSTAAGSVTASAAGSRSAASSRSLDVMPTSCRTNPWGLSVAGRIGRRRGAACPF